ncbi:helicase-exonuclease AddAB subunit AddA [Paenibacillus senegalensis]|uniref:helicase-exonuclease AddAB subunit AddA n=1 Tax=Paenibacillus senegalensis TaxID=1465766 RepID=UPI000289C7F2|nr:helicase-exonuclease AddAB subunit AddA [Paenibacillus senegalensis]
MNLHEIPEKPQGTSWTNEQWEAIVRKGENILVAAAAGSGKTAVLVERIIRRISDEKDPVDVDRLLVATFTNAAAAEMKMRVREALEKALAAQPDSPFLQRQLALLHRASITTLHSFCLDVIRRHFQRIGLDPGFRIANETETELLRQDVLEELFEERYASEAEDSCFWQLLDWFGGERSDEALFALVQQLYDASRSHPQPARWLQAMAQLFNAESNEPSLWYDSLYRDIRLELEGISGLLRDALKWTRQPGGPALYEDTLQEEAAMVESLLLLCEGDWTRLYEAVHGAAFGRLKSARGDQFDKSLQDKVKNARDKAKQRFTALKEELFSRSPEQYREELLAMYPLMHELVSMTGQFAERFTETKQARGLIDFTDLEHYCLEILADSTASETLEPSAAALEYREQYIEILLDEYQDTNLVQEAIIQLIAQPEKGNRFMVGDVKQSIYRFRLAEPGLFLEKYRNYGANNAGQRRIDLASNFRSRKQVVHGVNFLFRQMMKETVAEMDYDEKAELVYGASYYEAAGEDKPLPLEWMIIDRSAEDSSTLAAAAAAQEEDDSGMSEEGGVSFSEEIREMETAQLEARAIVRQIHHLLGMDGGEPFRVYDKNMNGMRPVTYRDIVILLRATQSWAPVFLEELRQAGIPAYADLNSGYFSAVEVEIMIALLRVIDNPYQDIPLAGVLRSPIVGLSADELARIRLVSPQGSFYEAVSRYVEKASQQPEALLYQKISRFYNQLQQWRTAARQGSLAELVWNLFRETGYYDFVGGMPGGLQRQANLRALHDRARQYESTSLRGLFRFLRFIERMQESGGDLGTARALGEQEDVVRIISIHKSKGLEFPVVFLAGIGKLFNQRDLYDSFLIHKELGFGPAFIDLKQRVSYPTLPAMAIKKRMRMEMLAEEMRVLYVALTRAREKLYLVGSVASLAKQLETWAATELDYETLPDHVLAKARSYLDWLGPALFKHRDSQSLRESAHVITKLPDRWLGEQSQWNVSVVYPAMLAQEAAAAEQMEEGQQERLESLQRRQPVELEDPLWEARVAERIHWTYPFEAAAHMLSKTTVTELKRMNETWASGEREVGQAPFTDDAAVGRSGKEQELFINSQSPSLASIWTPHESGRGTAKASGLFRRPRFIEQQKLSAAEKGTIYHAILQHIPLDRAWTMELLEEQLNRMVLEQKITEEQLADIDPQVILDFIGSELGQRLAGAKQAEREIPFTYGLAASEVYPVSFRQEERREDSSLKEEHDADRIETILVQGIIDCLFEEEDGWVLLDYKSDHLIGREPASWAERYQLQLSLYRRAVEEIWRRPVKEVQLVFLNGGCAVDMSELTSRSGGLR